MTQTSAAISRTTGAYFSDADAADSVMAMSSSAVRQEIRPLDLLVSGGETERSRNCIRDKDLIVSYPNSFLMLLTQQQSDESMSLQPVSQCKEQCLLCP